MVRNEKFLIDYDDGIIEDGTDSVYFFRQNLILIIIFLFAVKKGKIEIVKVDEQSLLKYLI